MFFGFLLPNVKSQFLKFAFKSHQLKSSKTVRFYCFFNHAFLHLFCAFFSLWIFWIFGV